VIFPWGTELEMAIMNRKYDWVFFDLDGTLADSIPALYEIYKAFLAGFGLAGSRAEFEELNGSSLPEIIAALKSHHNLKSDVSTLMTAYSEIITRSYHIYVKPVAGAEGVLQALNCSGYKLMLVTSSNVEIASSFIRGQEWDKYFDDYVFGNEITKAKPDPEIYRLAIKKAGIRPDAVVVVEDSCNGAASARYAGIEVVGFAANHTEIALAEAGAGTVISRLNEILNILEVASVREHVI